VALPEEGLVLRDAGIASPILCLGGFWEGQEESLIASRLTAVVFSLDILDRLDRAASSSGVVADYHLKVDTGMGRLGVPLAALDEFLSRATRYRNVRLDGIMTHMASADSDPEFTELQIARFASAVEAVRTKGHQPRWVHQANSAGAHAYPQSRGNLVRLGGVLYGLWRDVTSSSVPPLDWRPVMSLHSRIGFIKPVPAGSPIGYGGTFVTRRESRIATVPVGYEDGLSRALSNRGRVLVRGEFAPIVGRVSMDLTLVDVTGIPSAAVGDEVVIIGAQGANEISAEAVAEQIGTISYEVTCGISERVPRVYVGATNASP
jgi:alanine racemase